MENIYKVRIRTDVDPRGLYPSERRYSASTVLGLGVVHLFLAALALIFAALCLLGDSHITTMPNTTTEHRITIYLMSAAFLMCSGAILAGLSALLAWKRWYIDSSIRWFFISSCLSTLSSCISLALTVATVIITVEKLSSVIPLSVHVLIASLSESIWSVLSCRTSYVGMRNDDYPDDIFVGKSEKTPDILSHFHAAGKFARYFPGKENPHLPKAESHSEYQERVRKFLSFETDAAGAPK